MNLDFIWSIGNCGSWTHSTYIEAGGARKEILVLHSLVTIFDCILASEARKGCVRGLVGRCQFAHSTRGFTAS